MRKKSAQVNNFIENLHNFLLSNPQLRKDTSFKSEPQIQVELRPLIIRFLERYFRKEKFKDFSSKAHKSFYWEGQEGNYKGSRTLVFGSRNYPDFIITSLYLIAIEYKQSPNGSIVKNGIGQSIMHTLSGDFDYIYYLFHDESKDKTIENSLINSIERGIIEKLYNEFNVYLKFI